jgi:hypothetical protein
MSGMVSGPRARHEWRTEKPSDEELLGRHRYGEQNAREKKEKLD